MSSYRELLLAQIQRETDKLREMRTELFDTNWIGRIIFVIVHGVVFVGIWMSIGEFRQAKDQRRQATDSPQQEVKISLEGVAVKTQLQGVMILGFALAFHFLYLKFVDPVVVVGT